VQRPYTSPSANMHTRMVAYSGSEDPNSPSICEAARMQMAIARLPGPCLYHPVVGRIKFQAEKLDQDLRVLWIHRGM